MCDALKTLGRLRRSRWLAFQDTAGVKQRIVDAQYFGASLSEQGQQLLAIMVRAQKSSWPAA